MVRGEYSEWVDVISGVSQRSVLGPIVFLIYVNEIPEMVNLSSISIYSRTPVERPPSPTTIPLIRPHFV